MITDTDQAAGPAEDLSTPQTPTPDLGNAVTMQISRRVKPGREQEYEDWIKRVIATAHGFPGHLGVGILKPSAATKGDYVIISRFDTYAHQLAWEESCERAQLLKEVEPLVEGSTRLIKVSGLELWFELPDAPGARPPSPHKMAFVLCVVVFLLITAITLLLGPLLAELPLALRIAVTVVLQVVLMTYLIMPRVTAWLKDWLYA